MSGRKKWMFLSLALACVLALSFTLFSGGQGATSSPSVRKMPTGLQMLCALYNDLGVQKLGQVTRSQLLEVRKSATPEKRARIQFMLKMLGPDDTGKEAKRTLVNDEPLGIERLIDPVLQTRWDDPSFDVASGAITSANDPHSLESPYLKVRKAWQKDGVWKAFCEFAVFKAEEIAANADVRYLSLLPVPQPDNTRGVASTGAPRLRVGVPGDYDPTKGFTGAGVIVGDVDTGIDWTHGDFLNPDGTTRILYLWDTSVTNAAKTPEALFGMTGFNYGTVWTKAEIDGGSCTEYDPPSGGGHGTHTCGTAAGNGGATGNYTGMAPNADIIFVKGLDPYGVEFVFEMASRLGRPAVVNNSWGISWAQYGPYYGYVYLFPGDGTDDYSQYFNYLTAVYPKGKIIVKSAGNNGMWQSFVDHDDYGYALYGKSLHFGGKTTQGYPIKHVYKRINHDFGYGKRREYSDMMIRSNVPVQVKVKFGNSNQSFTMQTGQWGAIPGASALGYPYTEFDLDMGQDPYNGEYMGYMWFDVDTAWGPTNFFPEGNWTINVTPLSAGATAKYDVWLYSRRSWNNPPYVYSFYDSCFTQNAKHDEYQLDWAASPDVITTGSWTTASTYLAADGYAYYPWGFLEPKLNNITYFSSPGPSRDGRMKPDIAAPGAVIMSALPYNINPGLSNMDPDLKHQWMWGTSMAAPHSTGGIALLLQKSPNYDVTQVRKFLQLWASKDSYVSLIGPNGFGAGKLNVRGLKSPPIAVVTVDKTELSLAAKQVAIFSGQKSYDPDGLPFTLKWVIVSTPTGAVCKLTPDDKAMTATLVPDPGKIGTYTIGLVVEGAYLKSTMATIKVKTVQ